MSSCPSAPPPHFPSPPEEAFTIHVRSAMLYANETWGPTKDDLHCNRTTHTKLLGVIVDQHLTFEVHIRYIKGKISRGFGVLYKAKRMLQEPSLLTLYYSFIYPYFTHCISVWGNTYPTVLDSLIKCQKRAVRIVHRAAKYHHTPIFQSLQILNLRKLYVYLVQIFLYKYRQQKLPEIFNNLFTVASTIHEHHTQQNNHYRAPLARCVQRSLVLRCSGAKINNSLLDCTNHTCAYPTFKYEVRKYLSMVSDADILHILA